MPPKVSTKAPAKKGASQAPPRRAFGAAKPAAKKPAAATADKTDKKEEKAPPKEPESPPKHITIGQKQIANVLVEDQSGEIRKEKKAVLVIDNENHIAARFLPYSGANVLEASDPAHMDPERIRMGVIGAVRHGKPLAIDFGETGPDMLDALENMFDKVQKGLLEKCLNREVAERKVYESLLKDTDEDTYKVPEYRDFEDDISAKFIFLIIMQNMVYPKDFTKRFYQVTIDQQ